MKQNEHLKSAKVYFENDCPYMELVYEYEDKKGLHELTFPKVEFPFRISRIPNVYHDNGRTPTMSLCGDCVELYKGNVQSFTDVYFIDRVVEPKVHEMTLSEIEEKLGYCVKIISEKENINA